MPASAAAQTTAPNPVPGEKPATGTTGTKGPATKPKPVKARVRLGIVDGNRLGNRRVALRGQRVTVRGAVSRHVAGQRFVVRVTRGGDLVKQQTVAARRVKGSRKGEFFVTYTPGKEGRVFIRAVHRASDAMASARALPIAVTALEPGAGPGSRGDHVRFLQQQLFRMHFAVPVDGRYRGSTERAVLAYRKVNGMTRKVSASARIFFRLAAGRGGYRVRYPNQGRHVEADLSRQILVLVNGRTPYKIFHTSSGAPSTPTVLGTYRFYMKSYGRNAKGMVHSSYFIRGYAIHGYRSVPNHPASHGCLRIPIPSANFVYNWVNIGDRISVYRS